MSQMNMPPNLFGFGSVDMGTMQSPVRRHSRYSPNSVFSSRRRDFLATQRCPKTTPKPPEIPDSIAQLTSLLQFQETSEHPNMSFLDNSMGDIFDGLPMNGFEDASMGQAFPSLQAAAPSSGPANMLIPGASSTTFSTTSAENVPGAGPLPTTPYGAQASMQSGSTLTEFTKRRNWPAKVVEELKDFLQILDANGRILHISPSITALTDYTPEEILGQFLKDLIHPDDVGVFVAELNESIASGNSLRMFYRLRKKDQSYAIFESVGHAHIAAAKFAPNPNNQSPFCQAVFMMSRPYPTKNSTLLDSFLEHKMENERLRRRIDELRKEEAEEVDEAQRSWRQSQEGRSDVTPSEDTMQTASSNATILI